MGLRGDGWTDKFVSRMDIGNRQSWDLHFQYVPGWNEHQHPVPLIDIWLAESLPTIRGLNIFFKKKNVSIKHTAEELYDGRRWLRAIYWETVKCTGRTGWDKLLQEAARKNRNTNWPQQAEIQKYYEDWCKANNDKEYDLAYKSCLYRPLNIEIGNISYFEFKSLKILPHHTSQLVVSSAWVAVAAHLPCFKEEDEKDFAGYGEPVPTVGHMKFGSVKYPPLNKYFYNHAEMEQCGKQSSLLQQLAIQQHAMVSLCLSVSVSLSLSFLWVTLSLHIIRSRKDRKPTSLAKRFGRTFRRQMFTHGIFPLWKNNNRQMKKPVIMRRSRGCKEPMIMKRRRNHKQHNNNRQMEKPMIKSMRMTTRTRKSRRTLP